MKKKIHHLILLLFCRKNFLSGVMDVIVVFVESSTWQFDGDAVFIVVGVVADVVADVVVMMGRGAGGGGERQYELVT